MEPAPWHPPGSYVTGGLEPGGGTSTRPCRAASIAMALEMAALRGVELPWGVSTPWPAWIGVHPAGRLMKPISG